MACRITAIGDALNAWLNDGARAWPLTGWTAARSWDGYKLVTELSPGLSVLTLTILQGLPQPDLRNRVMQEYLSHIVVRQKFADDGSDLDAWMAARAELIEDMVRKLSAGPLELTGQPVGYEVRLQKAEAAPVWDDEAYVHLRGFLGVVDLVWEERRPR